MYASLHSKSFGDLNVVSALWAGILPTNFGQRDFANETGNSLRETRRRSWLSRRSIYLRRNLRRYRDNRVNWKLIGGDFRARAASSRCRRCLCIAVNLNWETRQRVLRVIAPPT